MAPRKEVCKECKAEAVRVIQVSLLWCGRRVRRRRCDSCGDIFYTLQEAEVEIPRNQLIWAGGGVIGLHGPAEYRQKEKV